LHVVANALVAFGGFFVVTPLVFLNPQGNVSTFGHHFDDIIFPIPNKNIEISRLTFKFSPNYIELEIFQ
jgi:hypothetical protein